MVAEQKPNSIGIVLTQDYRKCRGMVEQFFDLLTAVVIASRVHFELSDLVTQLIFTAQQWSSADAVQPAIPPP
jgi:hypothetical protein